MEKPKFLIYLKFCSISYDYEVIFEKKKNERRKKSLKLPFFDKSIPLK